MPTPKNKYDREHLRRLQAIQQQIDAIYEEALKEAAAIGANVEMPADATKPFTFADYPKTEKRVKKLLDNLRSQMQLIIVDGVRSSWTLSNNKNNELCNRVFGDNVGKLTQAQYRRYYSNNEKALEAFIERKENGLKLSDRVWHYSDLFRREIEMGLDLGIRSGLDAPTMARDLKQYLRHPDKLFRRVRDEHGNLQLSKAAADFHPGRGVYRSSYLNARRLAATETNIAYRTADHERWKQMDFVVGIEIHLSNNHNCKGFKPGTFHDICDELQGRYPKDFKFTGWHPNCRCFATTVLKTDEEIAEDTKKILRGDPVTGESENTVEEVPKGFKDWVENNTSRIVKANTLPYFIADNSGYVAAIGNDKYPSTSIAKAFEHDHYKQYAKRYGEDKNIQDLLSQYDSASSDMGKALIVKQIKEKSASLSKQELAKWGVVDSEMEFVRAEYNAIIQPKQTLKTSQGQLVNIDEKKLDLLVYRDKYGKEFSYPIGIMKDNAFSAVTASEVINGFPPYLKKGIERVSFLDIPCPTNKYFAVEYNTPGFTAAATDGGKTTFYMRPESETRFSELMAHEAGHIIDKGDIKSSSKEWQEAVAADDAKYGFRNFPTPYASKHSREDFAESIMRFINDKENFKEKYKYRAAFLRKMAQVLSGHQPKSP